MAGRTIGLHKNLISRRGVVSSHPAGPAFGGTLKGECREALLRPEPHCASVHAVDADMKRRCASRPSCSQPRSEKQRSRAAALQARQQVHVQMRRILRYHVGRRSRRMMNHRGPALVGTQRLRWQIGWIGVALAERRPPLTLKPFLPVDGICRSGHKARGALRIFDDKGEVRFEPSIWCHIDVPHHPGIAIKRRGVAPG